MIASEADLHRHLARLATILWRYGADAPTPRLRRFDTGETAFALTAALPGPARPLATEIRLAEVWRPRSGGDFRLDQYAYDFIERPLNRRLAFHRHDEETFLDRFAVAVHEHCEEVLGQPECEHYYGLPLDAYAAIQAFTVLWGQPGPIGCERLRCLD